MNLFRHLRRARPVHVVSMPPACDKRCVDDLIALNVKLSESDAANRELYEENGELHAEIARLSALLEKTPPPIRPAPQPFAEPWPRSAAQVIARQAANLAEMQDRLTRAEDALAVSRGERQPVAAARFGLGGRL
jgi:hypothetical protein